MQNPNPSVALVPRATPSLSIDAYTPTTYEGAMQLAKTFAASRLLGGYGTPEQVMLVMATGAELGIPPTAALRGFYLVEGRIFMSSDLMVACCLRSPQCERFDLVESTDERATYEVQRRGGKPTRFSFSQADRQRAKLGATHDKYPATMLRHRAAAIACRAVFPDVVLGLYAPEEADEMPPARREVAVEMGPLPSEPVDTEIIEGDWSARFSLAGDAAALEEALRLYQAAKETLTQEERQAAQIAYKARRAALG